MADQDNRPIEEVFDTVEFVTPLSDTPHPRAVAAQRVREYRIRHRDVSKQSWHMVISPEWYRRWLRAVVIKPKPGEIWQRLYGDRP